MRVAISLLATMVLVTAPAFAAEVVPVQQFQSIQLRGGGGVTVVPGRTQRVTIVEGSSQFTRISVEPNGNLRIDTCNQRCPLNYRLQVQIQSPRVPVLAVDGGGAITVSAGFTRVDRLVAAIRGGGSIDTRALDAADVTGAVSGGGNMLVRASTSLTGAVHGGGNIRYWGSPMVTTAINGGGSVSRGS